MQEIDWDKSKEVETGSNNINVKMRKSILSHNYKRNALGVFSKEGNSNINEPIIIYCKNCGKKKMLNYSERKSKFCCLNCASSYNSKSVSKREYEKGIKEGRTQAISEFKEKLKERVRTQQTFDTKDGRLVSMYDTLEIIEKTSQEIKA